jgi:hypothetical protein
MAQKLSKTRRHADGLIYVLLFVGLTTVAANAYAISLLQIDDFQDGTVQNWLGATGGVLSDVGPNGTGDQSLLVTTTGFAGGVNSRLVIFSGGSSFPAPTQWTGDWTAAGVRRIALDVLNPNSFDLNMWLGIAGPGGPGSAGSTDAYVTKQGIVVPADEAWHTIEFDVLVDDFVAWGAIDNPAAALADVFQFRIIHSSAQDWRGAVGEASMLLDNIRVVPEPSAWALTALAVIGLPRLRRLKRCREPSAMGKR